MNIDNTILLMGYPIEINGIGTLYQPTIDKILSKYKTFEILKNLLIPFSILKESYNIQDENINNLDLLFMVDNKGDIAFKYEDKYCIELLIESLSFYFNENVTLSKNQSFLIGDKGIVNRDNFDILSDIILKINLREKPKYEKPPEFKNDRQRDIYYKIMAGRQRQENENRINFPTIIRTVAHGGDSYISYEEIKKMTIYQLMDSYQTILIKDRGKMAFPFRTVQIDPQKYEWEDWIDNIKIKEE